MSHALVGHSGFVGGNLLAQAPFEARFNSKNIDSIRGQSFDWLVCAGAPAEKWRANQDPVSDRANLAHLQDCLAGVRARRAILISTVDVYPEPVGVDEATYFDPRGATAYGYHRYLLEDFFTRRFDALIVRLPGLFGTGLKKNVLYDLLHGNALDRIHCDSRYQYYGLDRLWEDLMRAWDAGLRVVNFATAPLSSAEVAREVFGRSFEQRLPGAVPRYDFRTRHADVFGGRGGYIRSRAEVLSDLKAFVDRPAEGRA